MFFSWIPRWVCRFLKIFPLGSFRDWWNQVFDSTWKQFKCSSSFHRISWFSQQGRRVLLFYSSLILLPVWVHQIELCYPQWTWWLKPWGAQPWSLAHFDQQPVYTCWESHTYRVSFCLQQWPPHFSSQTLNHIGITFNFVVIASVYHVAGLSFPLVSVFASHSIIVVLLFEKNAFELFETGSCLIWVISQYFDLHV